MIQFQEFKAERNSLVLNPLFAKQKKEEKLFNGDGLVCVCRADNVHREKVRDNTIIMQMRKSRA